jgi:hypothetical protein
VSYDHEPSKHLDYPLAPIPSLIVAPCEQRPVILHQLDWQRHLIGAIENFPPAAIIRDKDRVRLMSNGVNYNDEKK